MVVLLQALPVDCGALGCMDQTVRSVGSNDSGGWEVKAAQRPRRAAEGSWHFKQTDASGLLRLRLHARLPYLRPYLRHPSIPRLR